MAWLHEALEWTVVSEQELLTNGLSDDQLRALRLLHRTYALGLILLRGPAHALDHAVGTTAS